MAPSPSLRSGFVVGGMVVAEVVVVEVGVGEVVGVVVVDV